MLIQYYKICIVNVETTQMKRHRWTTAVTTTSVQCKSNNKRKVKS
jgi:hypothetical protein